MTAARCLLIDAASVQVVRFLERQGIEAILLKGPVIGRWLYPDGSGRSYTDIDLLVPPGRHAEAAELLRGLGFNDIFERAVERETAPHARLLQQTGEPVAGTPALPKGLKVDLHMSFHGVRAPADEFWHAIAENHQTISILEGQVPIPSIPARAFLVALHAGAHGPDDRQPLEDLDRALRRVPDGGWLEAMALATRLGAIPLFTAGLTMLPAGQALTRRLGLRAEVDFDAMLLAAGRPPVADGLTKLARTRGILAKAGLVARKLAPSIAFMRRWSPLAQRGAAGLALAYLYRPIWILIKAPRAYLAISAAKRRTRSQSDGGA